MSAVQLLAVAVLFEAIATMALLIVVLIVASHR